MYLEIPKHLLIWNGGSTFLTMRFKNLQAIGSPFGTLPEYCLLHSPSIALISSLPWQKEISFKKKFSDTQENCASFILIKKSLHDSYNPYRGKGVTKRTRQQNLKRNQWPWVNNHGHMLWSPLAPAIHHNNTSYLILHKIGLKLNWITSCDVSRQM